MKINKHIKLISILASLTVWIFSCAAAFPWTAKVTLDVSGDTSVPASGTEHVIERSSGMPFASFSVPDTWTDVESSTDRVYGFAYKLNEISGSYRTEPEQFYIFYFDCEKYLEDLSDRQSLKKIERAIVNNILPDDDTPVLSFPERTIIRNGQKFSFYRTKYKDTAGKRHNVEFVFIPGKDGDMLCAVYVFLTSDHKDEAISLLQSIKINGD